MSPYRTPAVLVLNTRRTGSARLRRRAFRAWITVLAWWHGPIVSGLDYVHDTRWTQRVDVIARWALGMPLAKRALTGPR